MQVRLVEQRRVVVTGVGLISPVGIGTEETWAAILQGRSGIEKITLFDPRDHACKIAGEVKDFRPEAFIDRKDIKKTSRFIQFAIAAAEMAVRHAKLAMADEDPHRVGVHVGSGIGGFEVIEREHTRLMEGGPGRVSPFFITASIANLAAGQIAIRHGARGPNLTCATACTTGAHDIGEAFRILQRGEADVMLAGAGEAAVTPLSIAGFAAMKALSTRNEDPECASRPWDIGRDGFVTGEGAGILVLETLEHAQARNASILAEIVGYAANGDAFHTNAPPEDGSGIRRVMELALADAGISASDIAYLNAHATSTPLGDRAEATAIRQVFSANPDLWVSSTKSMTGHLLGGAGSLEAGLSVLALRDQVAPPMTNLETEDPACTFPLVLSQPRAMESRYVMSNSFGFGGTNASLIFKRMP
ncbi:beta-ketoacyl-ACP synthase II [Terriglobus aquaticus]|uniref:3-oxoacyl-[acyl-carrier-protein] synthase 2 n=1 Tax=Terriglobus aquaticus TaxID=940139 RepID=A0ABW9KLY3_9BACT|nr:beta-ketoacyl-ACP synthase II [Terriglobus aquaticus]